MLQVMEGKWSAATGMGWGIPAKETPSCGSGLAAGLVTFTAIASGMRCARREAGAQRPAPSAPEVPASRPSARTGRRRFGLPFLCMSAAVALAGAFAAEDVQAKSFWALPGTGGSGFNGGHSDGLLVSEGKRVSFGIRLSEAAPAGGLTFSLTAKYGSAATLCSGFTTGRAAAADVRHIPATVTVPSGHRGTEVTIAINNDTTAEGDECFQIDPSTSTSGWSDAPWFGAGDRRFRAGQKQVIIIRGAPTAFWSGRAEDIDFDNNRRIIIWSCPGFVDDHGFGRAGGSLLRS